MKHSEKAQAVTIAGVPLELRRKHIRHAYLRVKRSEGIVTLSVPWAMPGAAIECFVREKAGWIVTQLQKPVPAAPIIDRSYVNGGTLAVWGKLYTLAFCQGTRYAITLHDDTAIMTTPKNSTSESREAFARRWCRALLMAEIARMLPAWEASTGLKAADFRTKDMKTRWGSCNIKTKTLWLNLQLVKLPPACLEYVVLHELLHLTERGHGKRFYALLSHYMPDWKQRKAILGGRQPQES